MELEKHFRGWRMTEERPESGIDGSDTLEGVVS